MILTTKIILFSSIFYIVMSRHLDFRERFLERKRLRALNAHRVTVLNKLANTVIIDDITHYRQLKGQFLKKKTAIEKDFRRLLAMNGMKYTYKRDLFWRTWRSIPLLNGANKDIVCYRCNNLLQGNGTTSQNCGTWSIEESTPPCPYEFYSLSADDRLCGANITQYKDEDNSCPSVIKFSDLTATCDNPIETQWRFTKMYGVTEEHHDAICKNQDFCEIFTSYEITPEHVIFRMINSKNQVIYSRIMKPKNMNYICVEDCGHFNAETRKVTKTNSKPVKLDLLARKMKRNDHLSEIIRKKELLKEINENITKKEDLLKGKNGNFIKKDLLNGMNKNVTKRADLPIRKNENITKTHFWNKMNNNLIKREDLPKRKIKNIPKTHFRNKKELMNEIVTKREKLKGTKTKRVVLNETNDSDMEADEVLNEISKSDAGDLVSETNENDSNTEELRNEDSNANADGLNDSTHYSATKRKKLIKELLPLEEVSTYNWGGTAFDLVSVEVDALSKDKEISFNIEKGKSLHKPRATTWQDEHPDSIIHLPIVTPCGKLKKKEDYISYEDENQGQYDS